MWQNLCDRLSEHLNTTLEFRSNRSVSGGCINNAQVLETNEGYYFVKLNRSELLPMFKAEAESLKTIQATATIRCPEALYCAEIEKQAVLVLEYIPMQSAQPGSMKTLGKQLAALHRQTSETFGFPIDNNIGLTPQANFRDSSWIQFYKKHRLGFQFDLCERKGLRLSGKDRLLDGLEAFFKDYSPTPSLLHGDLWGGNVGFTQEGAPVIFDPACYYGDREADLAFTEMFGGFSSEFYRTYSEAFPINEGYPVRKRLYNLYHELNHYYLFGGGYGSQAQETVRFLTNKL